MANAVDKPSAVQLRMPDLRSSGVPDRVLVFGLAVVLFGGTLAFGAVQPWAIFGIESGASILLLLWAGKQLVRRKIEVTRNPLYWPILAFATLVSVQLIFHLTPEQFVTACHARLGLAYAMLFFLAAQLFSEEALVKMFVGLLVGFGCLLALFALVQNFTSAGKLYWVITPRFGGSVFGPYVNHNHYAGLMEMLFPFPLLLCLASGDWSRRMLLGFFTTVMAGSILLSGSRGGMVSLVVQLVVVTVLLSIVQRSWRRVAIVSSFAVATFLLVATLGGNAVISRLSNFMDSIGGMPEARLAIARDSMKMVAQKPLLGWGLGSFEVTYPAHRSFWTDRNVQYAHNDYLQALVETGVIGAAIVLWFVFALYRTGVRRVISSGLRYSEQVSVSALVGCTGVVVHSLFDFNLHIPANAAMFFTLAAIATGPPPPTILRAVTSFRSSGGRWRPGSL